MKIFEYLWDRNISITDCKKIPEDKATLQEIRTSCGIEVCMPYGKRNYLVRAKEEKVL